MKKISQKLSLCLPWLAAIIATPVYADSEPPWVSAGKDINNVSDLASGTTKGAGKLLQTVGAGICVVVLLVAAYQLLEAYNEARQTGKYTAFLTWLVITLFMLGLIIVLGALAYRAGGQLQDVGSTS